MAMNSWEEDELFRQWGWEKDLIQRVYIAPSGHKVTFDEVMSVTQSEQGEAALRQVVREFGEKQTA